MVKIRRKICIVTGARSEYGLLRWIIDYLDKSDNFDLILIVTGMHLSQEFGLTIKEIEKDGYKITDKVEVLLSSDTSTSICKSIGLGLIGFADKFDLYKPDLLLLLGDRYEIFSAAVTAMVCCIPIAHIHGGENTYGAIDESFRHGITKMSHYHFVAAEEYRKRVIQLGENPQRVFNVGGLGIDNIKKLNLLTKDQLQKCIDFKFGIKNLLVTFHPVTLEENSSQKQIEFLLGALKEFPEINLIFTMSNADTNSRIINKLIKQFCIDRKNACYYKSLGQLNYLSCLKYCDGVLGNSSSGLIEVPSFKKGTINIGDRQVGRLRAKSVIDCGTSKNEIIKAINFLYSNEFQENLNNIENPYGKGGASHLIINKLEELDFKAVLKKKFYDL